MGGLDCPFPEARNAEEQRLIGLLKPAPGALWELLRHGGPPEQQVAIHGEDGLAFQEAPSSQRELGFDRDQPHQRLAGPGD
jgi:hypothetical protein